MADDTKAISSEALRQATKLLADISQARDAAKQNALFRYHVELLIDQVERQELDLLDFLSECVMLAGQNMQDVRLQLLEYRMDQVENPAPPSIVEITINMALVMAVELAFVGMSYFAVPALLGAFMYGPVAARSFRASWLNRGQRYNVLGKRSRDIDADVSRLSRTANTLAARAKTRADLGKQRSAERYQLDHDQYLALIKALKQEEQEIQRQLQTIRFANEDLKLAEAALIEKVKFKSSKWSDYLSKYTAAPAPAGDLLDTAASRMAQDLGAAFKDYMTKKTSQPSDLFVPVFLTSEEMGRLLSDLDFQRTEVQEAYSSLRMVVRYTSDDDLLDDAGIQAFFMSAFDMLANSHLNLLKDIVRPGIVAGIEFLCWAAYLRHHGALDLKPGVSIQVGASSVGKHEIVNDVLVLDEVKGPDASMEYITTRSITATGSRYFGINVMTEYLADYLYKTFARGYLKAIDEAILPFEYLEANYTHVLEMPSRLYGGFADNTARTQRIGELKIIVILTFRHFLGQRSGLKALPFFGDETLTLGDVFPGFSGTVSPLEITEQELAESRAVALASLSVAVGQTDYAAMNYFVQSKTLLEIRFNDLMGLIDDFQIQRDLDLLVQEDEEELLKEIGLKRDSLTALYDQTLKDFQSSEGHAHLATQLETGYREMIEMIQNAPETDLVQEAVEWKIFKSVVHPESP